MPLFETNVNQKVRSLSNNCKKLNFYQIALALQRWILRNLRGEDKLI